MEEKEIIGKIVEILETHGISPVNSAYDDSGSLVSVAPDTRWVGAPEYGECLICIFADRVQKWQRATPFNYTRGRLIGSPEYYNTPHQMVEAVLEFKTTPKASCWA